MDTTIIIRLKFASYVILLVLHVLLAFPIPALLVHLYIIIWLKQHHAFLLALSFTLTNRLTGLASHVHPTVNPVSMELIAQCVQMDTSSTNKNAFLCVLGVLMPIMFSEYV